MSHITEHPPTLIGLKAVIGPGAELGIVDLAI
jgi:hypothetical protein